MTAVSEALGPYEWETAPFVELTDAELAAITAEHGLPPVTGRLPSTGVIHTIYVLGDECVLRVPKRCDEAMKDIRTEVVAVPVARAAGVATPALLVWDDSLDIVDVPFTVIELVPGAPLGARAFDAARDEAVYRDLGRQLATLHTNVTVVEDPNGWLDDDERLDDIGAFVERLVADDRLSSFSAAWVLEVLERLWPAVDAARSIQRFIHNDVQPNNVMVTPDERAVLIDWGDAAWSDPARDLNDVLPRAVPLVLAGYREVAPMDQDDAVEARVLVDQLVSALRQIGRRHGSRWIELLAAHGWVRDVLSRT